MKATLIQVTKYVLAAVLGAVVCLGGWDYYITRTRALNGQQAFEYLLTLQKQAETQKAQQSQQRPAPLPEAPSEVKK
jgi:hypothetical protein